MLYIVGTPIGNLRDMSERAVQTLKKVPLIIMESPTDSKRLLNIFGIRGKEISKFNDQNAKKALRPLVDDLKTRDAAYITSAGMPTVSDPGAMLVRAAREEGIAISVVPGPSAAISALAGSGILTHEFIFAGFPPKKQGALALFFKKYMDAQTVMIFYESPFRILKTMQMLGKIAPDSYVCASKEITKMFESYYTGQTAAVLKKISENQKNAKGEFTVVVDFRT